MKIKSDAKPGTYENPKKWSDMAKIGDIFMADPVYGYPDNAAGDYLIAQFDGTSNGRPFPYYGQDNADWKHAWSTTLIELITEFGLQEGAIYSNGLNQIGILVYITAEDSGGNTVPLSQDVLDRVKPTLQLIDYTTGDALPQGWSFTDQENEFHHLPYAMENASHSSELENAVDKSKFTLYLSCSPTPAITPLTVGTQLTMANGKTAASSLADSIDHSSVVIDTLPPKRYDLTNTTVNSIKLNNITLTSDDGQTTRTFDQYVSYLKIADPGSYIEKYILTKGDMATAPWMDLFIFYLPYIYSSYIWDPNAAVVLCRAIVGYKYNDDQTVSFTWGQGVLSNGGEKDGVGIYSLLSSESTNNPPPIESPPSILKDTQVSIYDQFGNSSLFTVVFNGKNGLLSLQAGAYPSWDPTGTGTFPTLTK
ncbi:hypothetical protein PHO31112_00732 [Pandoraea horticolens]|uniref:Uncharacterized protein n=1 Tax=Pandoraea horticolens TaxID=2508298 RepID=A0A5E4SGU1_9BURK|nr:hypothetical protein [Pandoraea horticolens]VVD73398.1 hypothetical protein PHO31112_00732 [Pandoraea horticolens]